MAALLAELLEEQRKQTELLKRSLYGRLQQLTADDVMAILGIGRTKLGEMVDDGVIPMYRLGGPTGPRRISAEALERVIRAWAERRP